MSVSDVSQKAIGNLGWNDIKLTAPVFVGDTIYAEFEVLAKREIRPADAGHRHARRRPAKRDGTLFMTFERTRWSRSAATPWTIAPITSAVAAIPSTIKVAFKRSKKTGGTA